MSNIKNERVILEDVHLLYIHIIYIYIYVRLCLLFVHIYLKRGRHTTSFEQFNPKKTILLLFLQCKNRFAMDSKKREIQRGLHFSHDHEKEGLTEEICIRSLDFVSVRI